MTKPRVINIIAFRIPCIIVSASAGLTRAIIKSLHVESSSTMASSQSQRTQYATVSIEVDSQVSILEMGVKFSYRLPSFSVIHVDLRHIKFQLAAAEGSVMLFDGFIRANPELEMKNIPLSLKLKDYCFVPVSVCVCVCMHI